MLDGETPREEMQERPADTRRSMDESELLGVLKAEEVDSSSYYTSELAADQASALDRYYAKPYGDEVDGRSQVRTHDVEDTLNWMLPDLLRPFLQSDDLVTATSSTGAGQDQAENIATCLNHVFWTENDGDGILHDFAFDGLLQRIGVVSTRWADPEPKPPQIYEGIDADQLLAWSQSPECKILSADRGQDGLYDVEMIRTPAYGRVEIEQVPPEEFRISRRAKSIQAAAYHARVQEKYLGEVVAMFPDQARALDPDTAVSTGDGDMEANTDPRVLARHSQEAVAQYRETSNHERRKRVTLLTEYLWLDFDGDGVIELRQIKRVGDVILENVAVECSEFSTWSPIRVSHKLVGRAISDTIIDQQKVRTVVTRRTLDSLNQSLLPRHAYNKTMVDPEDVDALVDAEIGGIVGVNGEPGKILMPLVTPDVTDAGFRLLEYTDQKVEQASGVTRHAQGTNPQDINKTATGIDLLQTAAGDRTELTARWLAEGLQDVLTKVFRLLCRHQTKPRQLLIKDKPVVMDPRTWSDEMTIIVHVAMSAANRQTQLGNLSGIATKQEMILQTAGPNNPVCGLAEYAYTLRRMVEVMGFKNPSRFFKPPPPPDPKMVEVQQRGEIEKAKLAQQQQGQQAELALKAQGQQQQAALDQQNAERKAAMEMEIAQQRIAMETQLAARKLEAETAIAQMKLQAETQLAQQKMAFDAEMRTREMAHSHAMAEKAHTLRAESHGSKSDLSTGTRFGGEVG